MALHGLPVAILLVQHGGQAHRDAPSLHLEIRLACRPPDTPLAERLDVVQTGSTQAAQGVSWATELGSASAAAREKAAELQEFTNGPGAAGATRFTVAGIPGAEGWTVPDQVANVLFTEGRCLMLVGDQLTSGADNKPPVVAAVRAVWARTHGKPGACAT